MIIKDECYRTTLREFAESYNLVLVMRERHDYWLPSLGESGRYYCYFQDSETKDGLMLVNVSGNGATKQAAIDNYAERISGKSLVIGALKISRSIIQVPFLIGSGIKL